MPFTAGTVLRDLIDDPEAAAILEKHLPGASTHPMLQQGLDMTLGDISEVPDAGLPPALLTRLLAALGALEVARAAAPVAASAPAQS